MSVWFLNGERLGELQIDELRGEKKVIVFGSLSWNKRLSRLLEEIGKSNVLCIYEPDPAKWGTEFEGVPVLQPAAGQDALMVSADQDWELVSRQAKAFGYEDVYFFLSKEKAEAIELYLETFAPYAERNVIPADRTFRYVHIMPDEKFFFPLAEIIEYGLDPNEHFFFIYDLAYHPVTARYGTWKKYQEWMLKYHNIYLLQNRYPLYPSNWKENRESFDRLLEYADKIIFHGEFYIHFLDDYFQTRMDVIRKKGVLLLWSSSNEYGRGTIEFIRNVTQYVRMAIAGSKLFQTRFIEQFEALRSAIWLNGGASYARITKAPPPRTVAGRNIFIAHCAHPPAKAIETLDYLTGIDESFHIYCITSYGDLADEIETYGKEKYGDRFTAVKDFMEYDRYVEFLSTMDLAIIGMEIMAGRDTLELLFWLGAKVYLKPGSDVWNRMVNERGYRPADYYSVKALTAGELLDNPDKEWNRSIAAAEFDTDTKVAQWKALFEYDWGDEA